MPQLRPDSKEAALRRNGCLHPYPDRVRDALFLSNAFFDPRDLTQVKYEMLRKARCEGASISACAARFGLSRVSYYRALRAWEEGRAASVAAEPARAARTPQAHWRGGGGAAGGAVGEPGVGRFGTGRPVAGAFRAVGAPAQHRAHPGAPGKKTALTTPRHPTAGDGTPTVGDGAYERLRREAVAAWPAGVRQGPAALALRGVAAWLRTACAPSPPVVVKEHSRRVPTRPLAPAVEVLVDMIRAHLPEEAA